jgi:hypothetical protein
VTNPRAAGQESTLVAPEVTLLGLVQLDRDDVVGVGQRDVGGELSDAQRLVGAVGVRLRVSRLVGAGNVQRLRRGHPCSSSTA